jgi:hypothetical protein
VQPLLQWKSNNYYYSECLIVAFATQYIKCMCRIILSFVTCLAVQYFPTLCYKMARFSENNILRQNECSGFFYSYVRNSSYCKKSYIKNYCHKCTNVFIQCTRYSCNISIQLEFCQQNFQKIYATWFAHIPFVACSTGTQPVFLVQAQFYIIFACKWNLYYWVDVTAAVKWDAKSSSEGFIFSWMWRSCETSQETLIPNK